jgi:hypothetical protein
MFRSSTIIRELVLSLAKVMLERSVNYVLIGYVVVWQHVSRHAANFSQAPYKLPEDGRRPKHVGANFI